MDGHWPGSGRVAIRRVVSRLGMTGLLLWYGLMAAAAQPDDPEAYHRVVRTGSLVMSVDGGHLYLIAREFGERAKILRYDLASGKREVLVDEVDGNVDAAFPDDQQRRLAYTADTVGDERYRLHIVDIADGSYRVPTPRDRLDVTCGFSHDGRYVYAARGAHIWGEKALIRIDARTGETENVLSIPGANLYCAGVSDDDRRLLVKRYLSNTAWQLGLLDVESGQLRWLIAAPGENLRSVTFNGRYIYFLSDREGGQMALWRHSDAAGFERVALPIDSELLSFVMNRAGNLGVAYRGPLYPLVALLRADDDGHWRRIEVPTGDARLTDVTLAQDAAERIVVVTEDGRPPRIGVFEGGVLTTLMNTDRTGLSDRDFARFESRLVESFDGTAIPTHLLLPAAATSATPFPMVVYVHGGPQDHIDPLYAPNLQRLANAGFVVVLPNVRGSSGFGSAFMDLDNGDWGGGHIRDLLAVAEYAAGLDLVAGRPRFVMGTSFGGYSVLSLISQYPDAFDGAVDLFGMSDLGAFFDGLTDQVRPEFVSELGFDPSVDPERARAMSPLYQASRIETPLQIHQGIHDPRVPASQSQAMVAELKRRGIPVEYHEYDEGHGFVYAENDTLARERIIGFLRRLAGPRLPGD